MAGVEPERLAVVTGPNLAREIAARQPSASVAASVSEETARDVQRICHTPSFRVYTNADVVGCELAGATKNVIALAVGMAVGLGFGANATASLITRGLAETSRLGVALGADPYTFAGLAGLGDLVATCASPLSRNRTFGEELGRGVPWRTSAATRQVAEGVLSCASVQAARPRPRRRDADRRARRRRRRGRDSRRPRGQGLMSGPWARAWPVAVRGVDATRGEPSPRALGGPTGTVRGRAAPAGRVCGTARRARAAYAP